MKIIKDFIKGSKWLRSEVEDIYKKCLKKQVHTETPNWYMCFMSEEFNDICPDYCLKALCKEKILED